MEELEWLDRYISTLWNKSPEYYWLRRIRQKLIELDNYNGRN